MSKDAKDAAPESATQAPWQREFFKNKDIFQCIQQPERLRHANQRFQRALAVGLEFAQRTQGQPGHLRQFTLR